MNNWLKVALYTFIAIIIGSFTLGIVSSGTGTIMNASGGWDMPAGYTQGQMITPDQGSGMYGMGMYGGMGTRGMGMHGRR